MADRYSFQSPFSRGAGANPWFMVGSVAVTTSVFVTGLAFLGLMLLVIEGGIGPVGGAMRLNENALLQGQVWRFATYIVPAAAGPFFALIGMAFFYFIGSAFEGQIGRRAYTALLVTLTIVPAVIGVLLRIITGETTGVLESSSLGSMFFGMACGYAAANMQAKSFFGIPFWGLLAFFFVVQVLGLLISRSLVGLVMLFVTVGIALIVVRSLGFSNVEQIPTVPLPGFFSDSPTGTSVAAPSRPRAKKKKTKKSSSSHLRSVPDVPTASEAEIDALLDQVSDLGFDSLTKQQKQTLERHSKEMRKRRDS